MTAELAGLADCRNCLCLASRKAARKITAAYDRRLRRHGLKATQFTLLSTLLLKGESAVGELARFLGMERTTLTRNVALLEAKGWVQGRGHSEDARSRQLSITPAGRALVRAALPDWRKAQESVSSAFGTGGVAALQRLAGMAVD